MDIHELETGKIYTFHSGDNRFLGRFREVEYENGGRIRFFDYLHHYSNFEAFYIDCYYLIPDGIRDLAPASLGEKLLLIKFEIENNCI